MTTLVVLLVLALVAAVCMILLVRGASRESEEYERQMRHIVAMHQRIAAEDALADQMVRLGYMSQEERQSLSEERNR